MNELICLWQHFLRKPSPRPLSLKTHNFQIEITTIASNYHIEVNPSDCGIYDRVVIQVIRIKYIERHIDENETKKKLNNDLV